MIGPLITDSYILLHTPIRPQRAESAPSAMDTYTCYAELARAERDGIDYEKVVQPVTGAQVAVIAPHGGGIEPGTDTIAAAVAGLDFSYYCFRGCKPNKNRRLHITSHRFDEPNCVALLASHTWVIAIHGCNDEGEQVFLGGLDTELITDIVTALAAANIRTATDGHAYPGTQPDNICNRGAAAKGAQIELTRAFRDGRQTNAFVQAVRSVLLSRQARAALPAPQDQKSQPKLAATNKP